MRIQLPERKLHSLAPGLRIPTNQRSPVGKPLRSPWILVDLPGGMSLWEWCSMGLLDTLISTCAKGDSCRRFWLVVTMAYMSGRRAKAKRRANRERPLHALNAEYIRRSANAVLDVDLSTVPLSRVNQFAVGWMRAAFEQSRLIADLTAEGKGYLAAPNRRAFWEIALRLLWLGDMPQSSRAEAVDTMLEGTRATEAMTDKHMREMGLGSSIDLAAMEEIVLKGTSDPKIRTQAKNLTAAARATELNSAVIYSLWRDDSTWAHATGPLAGNYAPAGATTVSKGNPPTVDPDLIAHRMVTFFIVFTTSYILTQEGVESELANAPTVAFHKVK